MAIWESSAREFREAIYSAIPEKWILPSSITTSIREDTKADVSSIPTTCGLLSDGQIQITEQTASSLVEKLASGKLSSVDVTDAFCARAAIAHQLVRVLTI